MLFREIPIFRPFWLAAALAWCGLLFYLSSIPSLPLPYVFNYQDLLFHAGAYFVLYMLAARAAPGVSRWWVWLFVVLYGISDEWHQYFVPGRVCDVWDVLADALGGTIGVVIQRTRIGRCILDRLGGIRP